MSSNTFREKSNLGFQEFADNYDLKVAPADPTIDPYGIGSERKGAINQATTAYDTAIAAVLDFELAYRAAIATRNAARVTLTDAIADANGVIYVNPNVTPAMLTEAGLAIHDTDSSAVVPQPPVDLVAFGCQNGNSLKWGRNSNAASVTFVVQRQEGSGPWAQVGVTQKSRFDDVAAVPGAEYAYRVFASHNGAQSIPSNPASVFFSGGGSAELEVAA